MNRFTSSPSEAFIKASQQGKPMHINTTLTTQNEAWGFWGTMGGHACVAWPVAMQQIAEVTGEPLESVRAFLDSKQGRHFADSVQDARASGLTIDAAVAQAIAKWMDWKIGRITARETGIPRGLPYLTGFVIHCGLDEVCY
jgi:hypothetical protein